MNKKTYLLILIIVLSFFSGCGCENTPESVFQRSVWFAENDWWDAYYDLLSSDSKKRMGKAIQKLMESNQEEIEKYMGEVELNEKELFMVVMKTSF